VTHVLFSASGARWPCGIRDQFVREPYVRSMAFALSRKSISLRPCSTQVQSLAVTVTKAVPKASAADTKCGLSRALDTVRRYRFRLTTVIRNSFRLLTLPEKIPVPSEACSRNFRDRFSFRVRRSECSRPDATLCRNISRPSLDQHLPLPRYGVNSCGRGANLSCSGCRPAQPSDDRSYVRLDFV